MTVKTTGSAKTTKALKGKRDVPSQKKQEAARERNASRNEFSVIDICARIHGAVSGSSDTPSNMSYLVDWLSWRVSSGWDENVKHREFGAAVRELARAALREARQ